MVALLGLAALAVVGVVGLVGLAAEGAALDLRDMQGVRKDLKSQLDTLLDAKDDAGNKRELNEEELGKATALGERIKTMSATIETVAANRAKEDELRALTSAKTDPAAPAPASAAVVAPVDESKAVSTNVQDRAALDLKGGFRDYGDFVTMTQQGSREHALPSAWSNRPEVMGAYGNNTFSGEDGGFLVPVEFSNRIFERSTVGLPILEQTDRLTLAGNSIEITGMTDHDKNGTTYRYGGVIIYWVGEGNQITRSNLKFRKIKLSLNKMAAISFVTEEEMSDVNVNFGQKLLEKHALGIREELIEAVMFGTGAAQPLGAFSANSPAVITAAKEDSQDADTIVLENIFEMEQQLWSPSDTRAIFLYNREGRKQLRLLKQDIGTGGQAVALFERGRGEAPDVLDGYPAYPTEHCEKLGDLGDICLGDFSQYILATKGTTQTAMSQHLRFDYDETAFRSTFRVDGRPAWDQTSRPRKGATAKREAPFVKLIARA